MDGVLMGSDRAVSGAQQEKRLTRFLSQRCKGVVVLQEPKAVLIGCRQRRVINRFLQNGSTILSGHLLEPSVVGADNPIDSRAMLKHDVPAGLHQPFWERSAEPAGRAT